MNKLGFSNPKVQRDKLSGALAFNNFHHKPKQTNKSTTSEAIRKRERRVKIFYLSQLSDHKITPRGAQLVVDPDSNPPIIASVTLLSEKIIVACYTGKPGKARDDKVQFEGRIVSTENGDVLAVEEGRLVCDPPVECWATHGSHQQINMKGTQYSVAQQISGPIKFCNNGFERRDPQVLIKWRNTKTAEHAFKPVKELQYYNGTNRKRKPPKDIEDHLAIPKKVHASVELKWFDEFTSNFQQKEENVLPSDLDSELQRTNDKVKIDKEEHDDQYDALVLSATFECLRMRSDTTQSYHIKQLDNALGVEEGSIENIVSFATTMLSSQQTIKKEKKKEKKKEEKKEEKKKVGDRVGKCKEYGCEKDVHRMFYTDGTCYTHGNKVDKICSKCAKDGFTRMKSMKGGLCRVCHAEEVKVQIDKQKGLCGVCKARRVEESTVCFHCKSK